MITTAALFSTAILPGQAGFDTEAVTGLAEWRLATPMLFKLLIGAGTQAVAWPVYGDGEDGPCVLAAPLAQAQASWQALSALMAPPRDAAAIVARGAIGALLAGAQAWLVLDCVQLIPHDIGTPDYAAALDAVRTEAQALHAALLRGDQAALAPLLSLAGAAPASGYWSATASAQLADVEELDAEGLSFLHGLDVRAWVEDALCYEVGKAGQPDVLGLVTPYGRWIVPLSLNAVALDSGDAGDGWLTFATAARPDAHGVLDLNGCVALPPAPGALYVISPHLVQRIAPDGASRLLRLPDGALLMDGVDNICQRDDGLFDVERQTHDDERNVCGVLDATGKVVLAPQFSSVQDFGTKKKIAIVSQRIGGRFLFGLVNSGGELLAPCQYEAIDCATTSSPPKLRKNLIFAIDAQGLACMLTLDGKPAFTPRYPPAHHLRGVAVQSDFLYVVKDGMAWSMDFTGRLLERFDTVDNFKAAITAQLSESMGLGKKKPEKKPAKRRSFAPAQILAKADREQLRAMAALLLPGNADLAARCVDLTLEELAEDDPKEEYEGDSPEAACFFLIWSTASHTLGHGTTLDWKAVDEVPRIAQHIGLPALRDFSWPEREDGDTMAEGLAAIAAHLAPHQLRLVNLHGGEDTYYLGVVRAQDAATFNKLALQAALRPVLL